MENHLPASPAVDDSQELNQPGAQAVEALVRAIAQEFVLGFDELHNAILTDDDAEQLPKAQSAGS